MISRTQSRLKKTSSRTTATYPRGPKQGAGEYRCFVAGGLKLKTRLPLDEREFNMFTEVFDHVDGWNEVRISTDQDGDVISVAESKIDHLHGQVDVHTFLFVTAVLGL